MDPQEISVPATDSQITETAVAEPTTVETIEDVVVIDEETPTETSGGNKVSDDTEIIAEQHTTKDTVEEAEVTKETVIEDVKENLTTESKETVDEIVEKTEEGEELNKHEKLVSDLLDELQISKTQSRAFELEKDVLIKTIEKLQEQVVGQKSNPNIIEVPDDLLPLVKHHTDYAKDRSNNESLMKLVNTAYGIIDSIGGPSVYESIDSFTNYKLKTNASFMGSNRSDVATQKPIVSNPTGTGGIPISGARTRSSFTNR